jgi:hypothetical protein
MVTGLAPMVQGRADHLGRSVADVHRLPLYGSLGRLEPLILHVKNSIARLLYLYRLFDGICQGKKEIHGMITFRLDRIIRMSGEECSRDLDWAMVLV